MWVANGRKWLASLEKVERSNVAAGIAVFALTALQMIKGFWFLLPADPATGVLFIGVTLLAMFYLSRGLYFLLGGVILERARLARRLVCLGWLCVSLVAYPVIDPYFQGARLRFWLQGGEAAYLRFATEARAKMPAELPPLSPEATDEQYRERDLLERARRVEFRASLDQNILNHHPTSWSGVGVDRERVQLSSGSGLTGSWGIEIHDQPNIPPLNPKPETRANPYLPRQKPMSPRVWYWESD